MNRRLTRSGGMLLGLLFAAILGVGCAQTVTTGSFVQVDRIESDLKRGVSTKMDVRRVLGAPKGLGGAVFPIESKPLEVWYYDDIAVTDARSEGGVVRANVRQQILLVFFDKEVLDGFMWFAGGGATQER